MRPSATMSCVPICRGLFASFEIAIGCNAISGRCVVSGGLFGALSSSLWRADCLRGLLLAEAVEIRCLLRTAGSM